MNKRGVSPLMATLLLIAFAVALGAVVMSWGKSYIEEKAEFVGAASDVTGCEFTGFNAITVSGAPQVCYNKASSSIELFLENGPTMELAGMQARVVGSTGVYTQDNILPRPLKPVDSAKINFNYGVVGEVKQLKLIPRITAGAEQVFCTKQAVMFEKELRPC